MYTRSLLLLAACLVVIPAATHAQQHDIKQRLINKEWVGPAGEYLKVGSDSAMLAVNLNNIATSPFYLAGNKLIFTLNSYATNRGTYTYTDTFTVARISNDTLVIADMWSAQPYKKPREVIFVNRHILNAASFSFEKLFFSFTNNGGIQVAVDSTGVMYCSFRPQRKDAPLRGTYKAQLSPAQLNYLENMVKESLPDRLTFDRAGIDGGQTILKIWYDHKFFNGSDGQPSYLAISLRNYLMSMPHYIHIQKISDDFDIEKY